MGLFGKSNDIKFFRGVNREVLHKLISIYIDIYQLSISNTEIDLYGEAKPGKKYYFQPVRVACKLADDEYRVDNTEKGIDRDQQVTFKILRDDLIDANLYVKAGDIIHWNNGYYEIENANDTYLYINKDPDTNIADNDTGWNTYVNCQTHLTRTNKLQIKKTRSGKNKNT